MTILLSLTRMMKKMFAAFAFNQSLTHSLTHSLIWNIVLACELVSEKQNKFRLQVSTCEVLIDHCHALQAVEPLPFQFD